MSSCVMSSLAMTGNRMQAYMYLIRGVPGEVANACVTAFSTMYMGIVASSLESWCENDECFINDEELCIKSEKLCIKNEGFCI